MDCVSPVKKKKRRRRTMNKKRTLLICITLIISIVLFSSVIFVGVKFGKKPKINEEKIQIVATLFPQYDFARQIAGDRADVTLLLTPGIESHSYEPTPADIIKISESDLFIYTGENMEIWAHSIIEGLEEDVEVLEVSKGISLAKVEEGEGHDHEQEESHYHDYDPHIWTSPVYAIQMCKNIEEELCKLDPENEEYYQENANEYIKKLEQIDSEIKEIVKTARRKEMIFGSKFAFYYFVREYGLTYKAAYDSCGEEAEPSAKVVSELINEINKKKIPVVYYEELTEPKIAKIISEQTGAKMLLFHSAHNVSKEDFDKGITYLDIMKQNIENLKEGLN